jgi:type I restriction enzyme M protein
MAIKKSDLYSSLWASCDELRGGMDASQYKDYVLFMLFIKYISDKYADYDGFEAPVKIPPGASFRDMVALKGSAEIGEKINTQIIQPLIDANSKLARTDFPDFNDPNKLGQGKEMVERLTNLVAIFQKPELDFSKNRAEHDDILGDAYEYLMRHFAQDSGKSKGQFYTPSEVSRVIAKVIGIAPDNSVANTSAYDPTCGSGSLLLKVAAEAGKQITLEGQEKDVTTAGLARMNMILHDFPGANIVSGNTLANPKFLDGDQLRTYDYVVANPPFSDKSWSTGLTPEKDVYQRFVWGAPPAKQGDYAYLLHIVRALNSTGKAACILPHGVLFRGNAEALIRRRLIESGILKGIIGLPANLFYGTGIPACILVLDKENAKVRGALSATAGGSGKTGILMIDASKGFIKDGNKNRLREQDIHKIVDTFNRQQEVPRYSRLVPFAEISDAKNDFNLNLPRYIDSSEPEDIQDIDGHLRGGIPQRDIDAFAADWQQFPTIRAKLFKSAGRKGYLRLAVPQADIKSFILNHEEFVEFNKKAMKQFSKWRKVMTPKLTGFDKGQHPKELIHLVSEMLLSVMQSVPLVDAYDLYQHLLDYWAETMQDDVWQIAADGWAAKPQRVLETDKKGKTRDKGWACDLIPKQYLVARYFAKQQAAIDATQAELEAVSSQLAELEEEHSGEEGYFGALEKIAKAEINARLKEIKNLKDTKEEIATLKQWLDLSERESHLKRAVKTQEAELDQLAHDHYAKLSVADIKTLVIDDKWMARLHADIQGELDRVSQTLTGRIRELAERYATPLPQLIGEVEALSAKVDAHLAKMGAVWK